MMLLKLSTPSQGAAVGRSGRRCRRTVVAVTALVLGLVWGGATPAGADPVEDAKAAVAAAQQAADASAVEYEAAIGRYEEVTAQIVALQAEIAANKEEAARLQEIAERRAVEAYTGHGTLQDEEAVLTTADPLDVLRREKLLARTKRREDNAIRRLARINHELDDQRATLEEHQAEQARALEVAQARQAEVQAQLTATQTALATLEEYLRKVEEAQRARDIAASIAREASNRAGGRSGAGVVGGIVCPIRGAVSFIDSWGHPRHQGSHQGVDLMAARNTPNVAVVSGLVTFRAGNTSGNGAYLSGDDGNLYYYFHLEAYEGGPRRVAQGEVIGYVGNTGDARYTATHTHFEIHPGHGAAVNPYPSVRAVC
ncbi:MAG: M23 family metallopeptidase [Actinobacteria bacterium]|nr:M23 family metallopeptidase [Actinomycetota bacterium]